MYSLGFALIIVKSIMSPLGKGILSLGLMNCLIKSKGQAKTLKSFMDLMNIVFRNYLHSFVIVFIYYILVYLNKYVEHMYNLRVVLKILKKHQLHSKYSKCAFLLRSVAFQVHSISSESIKFDLKKTEAVMNLPRPLNPTDIRSFLGLAR